MKVKPNIDAFLEGAEPKKAPPAKPHKSAQTPSVAESAGRITKTVRMAADVEKAVKELAYERWQVTGKRVTESDIIDDALRNYLNM